MATAIILDVMATWPSGKAGVCKTLIAGSIPAVASKSGCSKWGVRFCVIMGRVWRIAWAKKQPCQQKARLGSHAIAASSPSRLYPIIPCQQSAQPATPKLIATPVKCVAPVVASYGIVASYKTGALLSAPIVLGQSLFRLVRHHVDDAHQALPFSHSNLSSKDLMHNLLGDSGNLPQWLATEGFPKNDAHGLC